MCINNPDKPCKSNGQCGGACKTNAAVKPVQMVFDSIQWYKAVDYADLLRMLQQDAGKQIRLLGANTGTGKLKSSDQFELTNINLAPVSGNLKTVQTQIRHRRYNPWNNYTTNTGYLYLKLTL